MSAVTFHFTCGECGSQFTAPGIPEGGYGEFVLRSEKGGDAVYVDALASSVFAEVGRLVRRVVSTTDEAKLADLHQKAFGRACDVSSDGSRYRISLPPKCPVCGARKPASWEEHAAAEQLELPHVTHMQWERLNEAEKLALLRAVIT
jgi:hypothetical protein